MHVDRIYVAADSGEHRKFVKGLIDRRLAARLAMIELCKQYGGTAYNYSRDRHTLTGITAFTDGLVHPDFKHLKKRKMYMPVKGSAAATAFREQTALPIESYEIMGHFSVPGVIGYKGKGSDGSSCIGFPFSEAGVLSIPSRKAFYGLWLPDVAAIVAEYESKGYTVDDRCKSFKPEWPGCRVIEEEEFDILVSTYNLEQKRKGKKNG